MPLNRPYPQNDVRVNSASFASRLSLKTPLFRSTYPHCLGILPVIRRYEYVEPTCSKEINQIREKPFCRPRPQLTGHAYGSELHSMHDLIDLVNGQSQDPSLLS